MLELLSVPYASSPLFFFSFFLVFMGLVCPGGVCGLLLRDVLGEFLPPELGMCDPGVEGTFLLTTLPRTALGVAGVTWFSA